MTNMEKLIVFCKKDYFLDKLMKFVCCKPWWVIGVIAITLGFTSFQMLCLLLGDPSAGSVAIVFLTILFSLAWYAGLVLLSINLAFDWLDGDYKKIYKKK